MSNTLLTPSIITKEALRILHQKLNFVGTIYRDYDKQYAKTGAKIGSDLKIRLPNRFTVTTGATLVAQDITEDSVTLSVTSQKHVGMNFTMSDLTLTIDDFSGRYIAPAMAVLAANIESDAMSMYKDVYNQTSNVGSAITFAKIADSRKKLNDALAPQSNRTMNLNTQDEADALDAFKGLFQASDSIATQYKEGSLGRILGYDFYSNSMWVKHTSGSDASGYAVNGTNTGTTLNVKTGTGTFKKGDIITIGSVNRVHPETKVSTGSLHQFVVTADAGGSASSITISPGITITGATQNCDAAALDGAAITKVGTASQAYGISMAYHKEAFAFATVDLMDPSAMGAWGSRQVQDGISLRIVRQYDINNDKLPCRIDVLYGYKTIRAQLATRLANQ